MNAKERYKDKTPALLIVPKVGTKRGWMARLRRDFEYMNSYIFRVYTPAANLEHQINKLPTPFKTVIFVNNPVSNYSGVIRRMGRKGIHGLGLHLFRKSHRRRIAILESELARWDKTVNRKLNEEKA